MAELRFECQVCRSALSADESQVGALVRCPLCKATLRVPRPQAVGAGAGSGGSSYDVAPAPPLQRSATIPSHLMGGGRSGPGKRYGFNCVYCSSRLEATESMAAQEGQCPTCGNNITIPILDRYGRLIDPITKQIIKQDPHPVHAYAAAGDRAPRIIRRSDGGQTIECPRCQSMSPITANNCKSCGMPFTMEGTTLEAAGTSNGFCVASLVLGIIGLPTSCLVIPSLLAIVFGIIGYNQVAESGTESPGKGMAIAGVICGAIGAVLALYIHVLS
jgi:DNA-directed RNA polymerase subunit RPC12/RpoP